MNNKIRNMAESLRNHWVPLYCYPGWVYVLADYVMIWISVCKKMLLTHTRRWLKECSRFCLQLAISSGVEASFRFFEMAVAFALAKALLSLICSRNIKLVSFISSRGCHLGFDFHSHYCFFYLVFRLLWKSSLFELFRLNNKQGWIFRRCRRAKEFMSSPVLSNHHRRKPSV